MVTLGFSASRPTWPPKSPRGGGRRQAATNRQSPTSACTQALIRQPQLPQLPQLRHTGLSDLKGHLATKPTDRQIFISADRGGAGHRLNDRNRCGADIRRTVASVSKGAKSRIRNRPASVKQAGTPQTCKAPYGTDQVTDPRLSTNQTVGIGSPWRSSRCSGR